MPILSKIIDRHGDIAKNCKGSMEYRSMFLDRICRIVYELDKKNVTNIKDNELEKQIVLVDDIKTNDVEVNWLHTRLTEIRVARQFLEQLGPMKDRFDSNRESIEIAESTLKAFEDKKMEASEKLKEASEKLKEASKNFEEICKKEADWKEKLARSQDKSVEISQTIENATSKVKQFLNCSLINDLL
jgi:chromosome segregation ATPase